MIDTAPAAYPPAPFVNTAVLLAERLKGTGVIALPATRVTENNYYEAYCHWAVKLPSGVIIGDVYGPAPVPENGTLHDVAKGMTDFMIARLEEFNADIEADGELVDITQIAPPPAEPPPAPKPAAPKKAAPKKVAKPARFEAEQTEIPVPLEPAVSHAAEVAVAQEHAQGRLVDDSEPAEPQDEPVPRSAVDSSGEHVVTYGRHTGKRLKEVPRAAVEWYAKDFAPTNPSPNDVALINAARSYLVELVNAIA